MGPEQPGSISMKNEFARKGIHLASLSIPIVYYFITKKTALSILLPMLAFSVAVDIGRHYIPWLKKIVTKVFQSMLRAHEKDETKILLSGATYVLISAALSIFIFPKLIAITAFTVLIVADASSALIGRMYGKHRFLDKSAEGSLAFIVSACIVILVLPKVEGLWIEYAIGFIAAILGAIIEASSVRLHFDDNLAVPATVGFTMWSGYYLLDLIDPGLFHSLFIALMHFE